MRFIKTVYCSRCIYNTDFADIEFDDDGVCNYCTQIEQLKFLYLRDGHGEIELQRIISMIKKAGRKKKYDCIVGVSGGTDSSYVLMKAKDWGLRPLAVHYDNTWNSSIASQNIYRITKNLHLDLRTFVVDNKEIDDIKKSFLLAGVREFDADTDIAFVQVLRSVAAEYRIKYILEGHSFLAEGLTPVGKNYLDGGYVQDVHKKYGSLNIRSFPNMTFTQFLKWILIYRQKFIRPLWYLNYSKSLAKKELNERLGWLDYKGHHLENYSSSFAHKEWLPKRFNLDYRILTLSADVRENRISRTEALQIYSTPIDPDNDLINYTLKRLNIDEDAYNQIISQKILTWRDFKNYKKRFEFMRPLFWIFAKLNLVPMSFYLKYCIKK